jgi:hypothetical protein
LPSDVFRDHFLTCFINDPIGVETRHKIGIENICWEMDYPHSDSSWPEPGEDLLAQCAAVPGGVPDDEIEAMAWRNALEWYSWEPFAVRPTERCTVRALRAEAAGHDVSVRTFDTGRYERTHHGVPIGELVQVATA